MEGFTKDTHDVSRCWRIMKSRDLARKMNQMLDDDIEKLNGNYRIEPEVF